MMKMISQTPSFTHKLVYKYTQKPTSKIIINVSAECEQPLFSLSLSSEIFSQLKFSLEQWKLLYTSNFDADTDVVLMRAQERETERERKKEKKTSVSQIKYSWFLIQNKHLIYCSHSKQNDKKKANFEYIFAIR